jgi:hypothetical protein
VERKLHLFLFFSCQNVVTTEKRLPRFEYGWGFAGLINCFAMDLSMGFRSRFSRTGFLGYSGFRGKVDAMKSPPVFRPRNMEQGFCFPLTKILEYCFNAPLYAGPDSRSGAWFQTLSCRGILS